MRHTKGIQSPLSSSSLSPSQPHVAIWIARLCVGARTPAPVAGWWARAAMLVHARLLQQEPEAQLSFAPCERAEQSSAAVLARALHSCTTSQKDKGYVVLSVGLQTLLVSRNINSWLVQLKYPCSELVSLPPSHTRC